MTTSSPEGEEYLQFDSVFFNNQINCVIDTILPQFNRMIKRYSLFHFSFVSLGFLELLLFFFFLTYLIHSYLLSVCLAQILLRLDVPQQPLEVKLHAYYEYHSNDTNYSFFPL